MRGIVPYTLATLGGTAAVGLIGIGIAVALTGVTWPAAQQAHRDAIAALDAERAALADTRKDLQARKIVAEADRDRARAAAEAADARAAQAEAALVEALEVAAELERRQDAESFTGLTLFNSEIYGPVEVSTGVRYASTRDPRWQFAWCHINTRVSEPGAVRPNLSLGQKTPGGDVIASPPLPGALEEFGLSASDEPALRALCHWPA